MEQGFEAFLCVLPCSMRHGLVEALVQWFHVEMDTFHLSYEEYAVLPLNWANILGLRFGGDPVPIKFVSFVMVSELLGIPYPLTRITKGYFGPTNKPQICIRWLKGNVP